MPPYWMIIPFAALLLAIYHFGYVSKSFDDKGVAKYVIIAWPW